MLLDKFVFLEVLLKTRSQLIYAKFFKSQQKMIALALAGWRLFNRIKLDHCFIWLYMRSPVQAGLLFLYLLERGF